MSIGVQWLNVILSVIIDYGLMDIRTTEEIIITKNKYVLHRSRTDFIAGLDLYESFSMSRVIIYSVAI